jgi:hypothetical protein
MAPLYSVRPAPDGWLVFDILTGEVLVLDGRLQSGLPFQEADALVDRLNGAAIGELLSAPANDPGAPRAS